MKCLRYNSCFKKIIFIRHGHIASVNNNVSFVVFTCYIFFRLHCTIIAFLRGNLNARTFIFKINWNLIKWSYIFVFYRLVVFAFQLTVMYSDIIKYLTRLFGLHCGRKINKALMVLEFLVELNIEWFSVEAVYLAGPESYVILYTFKVWFWGRI